MMKIYELYVNNKGLFHYIDNISELPFKNAIDIQSLDLLFISLHGTREVSPLVKNVVGDKPAVTEQDLQAIASMLHTLYASDWINTYNVYAEELSLDTYGLTTTEVIDDNATNESTTEDTAETQSTNQVSGYNNDMFTDNEQDKIANSGTSKVTGQSGNKRELQSEVKGNISNRIDDRDKALNSLKYNFIQDTVFKDVGQTVGLLIY